MTVLTLVAFLVVLFNRRRLDRRLAAGLAERDRERAN
jgi:hypothetical protein